MITYRDYCKRNDAVKDETQQSTHVFRADVLQQLPSHSQSGLTLSVKSQTDASSWNADQVARLV